MSILDNARFWNFIYISDVALPPMKAKLPSFNLDGREMRIYAEERATTQHTPLFGGGDAYTYFVKFWVADLFSFEPTIRIFRYFQDLGEAPKPSTCHILDKELKVHPYSTQEEVDHALLMIALSIAVPDNFE